MNASTIPQEGTSKTNIINKLGSESKEPLTHSHSLTSSQTTGPTQPEAHPAPKDAEQPASLATPTGKKKNKLNKFPHNFYIYFHPTKNLTRKRCKRNNRKIPPAISPPPKKKGKQRGGSRVPRRGSPDRSTRVTRVPPLQGAALRAFGLGDLRELRHGDLRALRLAAAPLLAPLAATPCGNREWEGGRDRGGVEGGDPKKSAGKRGAE